METLATCKMVDVACGAGCGSVVKYKWLLNSVLIGKGSVGPCRKELEIPGIDQVALRSTTSRHAYSHYELERATLIPYAEDLAKCNITHRQLSGLMVCLGKKEEWSKDFNRAHFC